MVDDGNSALVGFPTCPMVTFPKISVIEVGFCKEKDLKLIQMWIILCADVN